MVNRWFEAVFILFVCSIIGFALYQLTTSIWFLAVALISGAGIWVARSAYFTTEMTKPIETQRGNEVVVTVMQNGPFETNPAGSNWHQLGSHIELVAFPAKNHPFRNWTSNTELIEIANAVSATTTALVKGPGVITANFYE